MVTYLGHTVIYSDIMVTFYYLRSILFFKTKILFLKSEERIEEKEIMICKPSFNKAINVLTKKENKRHDEEMNEVKEKSIKNKLKQPTPR